MRIKPVFKEYNIRINDGTIQGGIERLYIVTQESDDAFHVMLLEIAQSKADRDNHNVMLYIYNSGYILEHSNYPAPSGYKEKIEFQPLSRRKER